MKSETNVCLMRNTHKIVYYVSNIQKAKKLGYDFSGKHGR